MDSIIQWFENVLGIPPQLQGKLLATIITLVLLLVLRSLAFRVAFRFIDEQRARYRWRNAVNYTTFFLALLIVGRIYFEGFGAIVTYFGLLSAGLAIALKDPITDLAAWLFIVWRRPFELGDRIQIGDYKGDVIDIRVFRFTILEVGNRVDAEQSTGRIIHIPNAKVFTYAQTNYNKGFEHIWNEIPVLVTFESDWQKTKQLLADIIDRQERVYGEEAMAKLRAAKNNGRYIITYSKLTPIVYTTVKDSGIMLTIRYVCGVRRLRKSEERIWEDILLTFAKYDNIDLAYPTQRFYNNLTEGKLGTRPKE